jgi:hypothetical protein
MAPRRRAISNRAGAVSPSPDRTAFPIHPWTCGSVSLGRDALSRIQFQLLHCTNTSDRHHVRRKRWLGRARSCWYSRGNLDCRSPPGDRSHSRQEHSRWLSPTGKEQSAWSYCSRSRLRGRLGQLSGWARAGDSARSRRRRCLSAHCQNRSPSRLRLSSPG